MTLSISVRVPHLLLIAHSILLSVSLCLHILMTKMCELRGQSEFAKNTFGVFSVLSTCLTDFDLTHCVISADSIPTGLCPTVCRCGKSWIIYRTTSCVIIWSRTSIFLARTSQDICLAHILTSQIRFRVKKVMMFSDPKNWDHILPFMQPGIQGIYPLLSLLPIQGRRCKNCQYQTELAV